MNYIIKYMPLTEEQLRKALNVIIAPEASEAEKRAEWENICRAFVKQATRMAGKYDWRTMEVDDAVSEWAEWLYNRIKRNYTPDLPYTADRYIGMNSSWIIRRIFKKYERHYVKVNIANDGGTPIMAKKYVKKVADASLSSPKFANISPENSGDLVWCEDARLTISILKNNIEGGKYRLNGPMVLLTMQMFLETPKLKTLEERMGVNHSTLCKRFGIIRREAEELEKCKWAQFAFTHNIK